MYKLRELQRSDFEKINKWQRTSELVALLGAPFCHIISEVDIQWFENCMSNRGSAVRCSIVEENDEILGLISLTDIDFVNQSAELHVMIGDKENQGKGIGTYAVKAMLSHAFRNMNMHRIELGVLDQNLPAIRLCEKCGFVLEGLKKSAICKNGSYVNLRMYACLHENYINYYEEELELPNYCVREIKERVWQYRIVRELENIFEIPLMETSNIQEVLSKINVFGIFLEAYTEKTLGFAAVYANDLKGKEGYITLIGVDDQMQRQGVGRRLLQTCEDVARCNSMNSIRLEVSKTNNKAMAFYIKNGFYYCGEDTEKTVFLVKKIEK